MMTVVKAQKSGKFILRSVEFKQYRFYTVLTQVPCKIGGHLSAVDCFRLSIHLGMCHPLVVKAS